MKFKLSTGKSQKIEIKDTLVTVKNILRHINNQQELATQEQDWGVFDPNTHLVNPDFWPEDLEQPEPGNDSNIMTAEDYFNSRIQPMWNIANYTHEIVAAGLSVKAKSLAERYQGHIEKNYEFIGLGRLLHIIDNKTYLIALGLLLFLKVADDSFNSLPYSMFVPDDKKEEVSQAIPILEQRMRYFELHSDPIALDNLLEEVPFERWEREFLASQRGKIGINDVLPCLKQAALVYATRHALQRQLAELETLLSQIQQLQARNLPPHELASAIDMLNTRTTAFDVTAMEQSIAGFRPLNETLNHIHPDTIASHYLYLRAVETSDHQALHAAWKDLFSENADDNRETEMDLTRTHLDREFQIGVAIYQRAEQAIHEFNLQQALLQSKRQSLEASLDEAVIERNLEQDINNKRQRADEARRQYLKALETHTIQPNETENAIRLIQQKETNRRAALAAQKDTLSAWLTALNTAKYIPDSIIETDLINQLECGVGTSERGTVIAAYLAKIKAKTAFIKPKGKINEIKALISAKLVDIDNELAINVSQISIGQFKVSTAVDNLYQLSLAYYNEITKTGIAEHHFISSNINSNIANIELQLALVKQLHHPLLNQFKLLEAKERPLSSLLQNLSQLPPSQVLAQISSNASLVTEAMQACDLLSAERIQNYSEQVGVINNLLQDIDQFISTLDQSRLHTALEPLQQLKTDYQRLQQDLDLGAVQSTTTLIRQQLEAISKREKSAKQRLGFNNQALVPVAQDRPRSSLFTVTIKPTDQHTDPLHVSADNSCFSNDELKAIYKQITVLQKEIDSWWPYWNKPLKKVKMAGLYDLLRRSTEENADPIAIINTIEHKHGTIRAGSVSTRTAKLLDMLRSSVGTRTEANSLTA